jgi:hypothetical protein
MKTVTCVIIGGSLYLAGIATHYVLSYDDGRMLTSSAPFTQIPQDQAEFYTSNFTPDAAIQPTKAFMLTNDIIQSLKFINDSLKEAGVGGAGVRVYFAATSMSEEYDSFVAIGVGDDGKDVPSTNSQNLFVKREPNTTIDPCPIMCDTSSPLNH